MIFLEVLLSSVPVRVSAMIFPNREKHVDKAMPLARWIKYVNTETDLRVSTN